MRPKYLHWVYGSIPNTHSRTRTRTRTNTRCTLAGRPPPLLSDTKFLDNLKTYDKDNIAPAIIAAVRPYMDLPDFDPATVKKASTAAYGLCCWVRAMEAYDRVAKVGGAAGPGRAPCDVWWHGTGFACMGIGG